MIFCPTLKIRWIKDHLKSTTVSKFSTFLILRWSQGLQFRCWAKKSRVQNYFSFQGTIDFHNKFFKLTHHKKIWSIFKKLSIPVINHIGKRSRPWTDPPGHRTVTISHDGVHFLKKNWNGECPWPGPFPLFWFEFWKNICP